MSSKFSLLIFLVTLSLLIGGLYFLTKKPADTSSNLDNFAQCLTEKGMVMYGAYWCSHCQNIKKLFGESFKYVKYIECTVETQTCTDNGINGYPIFIFADNSRAEGEQTLKQFSERTGCPLPEK